MMVLLAGCGGDADLGGSVGELFPLGVSRVEVHRNDYALQVTYYANRNTFLDVVIRVTVSLTGIDLKPGVKIPLQGIAEPGHQRTAVAHAPGGEPVRLFPNVKLGDMHLSEIGAPGQATRGDFSMLFESQGGDLGNNRTLTGVFATSNTLDAGYGPLP
jgi:hypothetical protein